MPDPGPTRSQNDLAAMVEMLLDKGVVINADIAVSIGETELLGIQLRAAVASFETAAEYGLAFPEGTDMKKVEAATSDERRTPAVEGVGGRPGGPADDASESDADDGAENADESDGDREDEAGGESSGADNADEKAAASADADGGDG